VDAGKNSAREPERSFFAVANREVVEPMNERKAFAESQARGCAPPLTHRLLVMNSVEYTSLFFLL